MKKTLLLTSKDIKKVIDIDMIIEAVEVAFRQHGNKQTIMPPKLYLYLDKQIGDFRAMPAFADNSSGIKWVNVHPDNPIKYNLPTVMATIVYNHPGTGFPLAIMDGTLITGFRTGAAGAIAAKYLARKESKTLGLVGSGTQAQYQMDAIKRLFDIEQVLVYSRVADSIYRFIEKNKQYKIRKASLEETVSSDIVCTTTPARIPIIPKSMLKKGTHINAIGADAFGKEELDPQILKEAKVIVDDILQATHSGEINVPLNKGLFKKEDIYATLGEVVAGKMKVRSGDEITVFDSTGLAIQDIAAAKAVYEKSKKMGLGREIDFVGLAN